MNDNSGSLKLMNSFFDSPHGLMNPQNVSTAYDMARLSSVCMQIPLFRKIAGTKVYECRAFRAIQQSVTQTTSQIPPANLMAAMGSGSSSCEESSE